MVFFFILSIVLIAVIVLTSLFSPQSLPWYRPHLILNTSEIEPISPRVMRRQPIIIEGLAELEKEANPAAEDRILKLETLLHEKNAAIHKLEKKLTSEKAHRLEFENVKNLLDEEIVHLRTQVKELKSKRGEINA